MTELLITKDPHYGRMCFKFKLKPADLYFLAVNVELLGLYPIQSGSKVEVFYFDFISRTIFVHTFLNRLELIVITSYNLVTSLSTSHILSVNPFSAGTDFIRIISRL